MASDCQLPVANSQEFTNWHLSAVCQLPIQVSASCQFTRICELASGCFLPVSYLALIVLFFSNRIGICLPGASCQFVRTAELANSCLLSVAYSLVILYNCLKSNWHLPVSCQLPIHKNLRIGIWLPFASCLFSYYALRPPRVELAHSRQLPVAKSLEFANWHLAAVCQLSSCLLPLAYSSVTFYNSEIELISDCQLPVANSQEFAIWHLAAVCQLPI